MTNNLRLLLPEYNITKIIICKLGHYANHGVVDGLFDIYANDKRMLPSAVTEAIQNALLLALKDKIINNNVTGLEISLVIPPGIQVQNDYGLDLTKAPGINYKFEVYEIAEEYDDKPVSNDKMQPIYFE